MMNLNMLEVNLKLMGKIIDRRRRDLIFFVTDFSSFLDR